MQSHRLVAAAVIALLCGSSGGGCFRREREGFIAKIRFEKKRIAGRDGERGVILVGLDQILGIKKETRKIIN